jgi:hypothetical protein
MAKDPGDKAKGKRHKAGKAEVVREPEGRGDDASLCYGEPIREAGRTIIPVARVHRGDWGIDAAPRGYIEIGPEGARFQPIDDPEATGRHLRAAATAALALLGALVGLRAARSARSLRRGSGRGLLGRGG